MSIKVSNHWLVHDITPNRARVVDPVTHDPDIWFQLQVLLDVHCLTVPLALGSTSTTILQLCRTGGTHSNVTSAVASRIPYQSEAAEQYRDIWKM